MFLARIDGTVVPAAKHATLEGCRFLVAQRLEADGSIGAEPLVLVDWLGAAYGSTVLVSTDGDIARERYGNTTPARMVVVGIVDQVQVPQRRSRMRLGIVRGHVTLTPAVPELLGPDAGGAGAGDDGEPAGEEWTGRRQVAGRRGCAGRGEGPDGGVYRGHRGREPFLAQTEFRWTRIAR